MINTYFLLLFVVIISFTIFYYEHSFRTDETLNLAYAHIFPGTPNAVFIEKDGYQIGFLPYPKNPKVNDDSTLLNLNVQKNGNDVGNTFVSLIIMDMNTQKIVHQVPYKFYLFADMSYPYVFKNEGKYSLSLLTKIAGDEKYENNPLIVTFELDTEGIVNKISNTNSIIIYSVIALTIIIFIIFIYRNKLKLIINKKSKT
jgi:preprotein translocase subunit SecY